MKPCNYCKPLCESYAPLVKLLSGKIEEYVYRDSNDEDVYEWNDLEELAQSLERGALLLTQCPEWKTGCNMSMYELFEENDALHSLLFFQLLLRK